MRHDVPLQQVRRIVERARRIDHLKHRYRDLSGPKSLEDFLALPLLDKDDIANIGFDLLYSAAQSDRSSLVFSSGGSTGRPKLSVVEGQLGVPDIVREWQPLHRSDVVLNLFAPGKLWSSHYFYNQLCEAASAQAVPIGALSPSEFPAWLDFFDAARVTVVAATPTGLSELLQAYEAAERRMVSLRRLLWVGEPLSAELAERWSSLHPGLEIWGLYGSTETWVVGYNRPGDPFDTFTPLPYQFVEIVGDGEVVVTNLHSDCLNVILRYQTSDLGQWVDHEGGKLRILGRADRSVKFRGTLLYPGELVDLVRSVAGVDAAQVVVRTIVGNDGRETGQLEIRICSRSEAPDLGSIRGHVLAESLELNNLFDADPTNFRVVSVDKLSANERTNKTPDLVLERIEC